MDGNFYYCNLYCTINLNSSHMGEKRGVKKTSKKFLPNEGKREIKRAAKLMFATLISIEHHL